MTDHLSRPQRAGPERRGNITATEVLDHERRLKRIAAPRGINLLFARDRRGGLAVAVSVEQSSASLGALGDHQQRTAPFGTRRG
jgi:hypothetical protein